jgi:hypothetical protein
MQITEITVQNEGKQTRYQFDNGFYAVVWANGFTLRGAKGGVINPSSPNYAKAKEAVKKEQA